MPRAMADTANAGAYADTVLSRINPRLPNASLFFSLYPELIGLHDCYANWDGPGKTQSA